MEPKNIMVTLVLVAVLILLVGPSPADYKERYRKCYHKCYHKCRDEDHYSRLHCKVECFDQCVVPPMCEVDFNCTFECAKSSCFNLDTETEDMETCFNSCSKNCAKLVNSPRG